MITPTQSMFSNASPYQDMYGQAQKEQQNQSAAANEWQQSRAPLYKYLQDQTMQQGMANLQYQQKDATRQNAFSQARTGTMGGSADYGAQARIAQNGLAGQAGLYTQAQGVADQQRQADANQAYQMQQQAYSLYDPVNSYGQTFANNQNAMTQAYYPMSQNSWQQQYDQSNELAGIQGAFRGGQIGSALSYVGAQAGNVQSSGRK